MLNSQKVFLVIVSIGVISFAVALRQYSQDSVNQINQIKVESR